MVGPPPIEPGVESSAIPEHFPAPELRGDTTIVEFSGAFSYLTRVSVQALKLQPSCLGFQYLKGLPQIAKLFLVIGPHLKVSVMQQMFGP